MFTFIRPVVGLLSAAALIGTACSPAAPASTGGTAATAEPIKIGYVWGVTGAVADIVRPVSEATHAYFDDLNKHGGIHGHPVQMVEIDSQYQVPLAQDGYKKVTTDDHVPLVVLASTGDTEALAPQINADRVVALTLSCDEKWSKPQLNPYIFTICTTYQDQMSGAKASRPGLDRLMADARKRRFDVALVWKLDRFGRSLVHCVSGIQELVSLGVRFIATTQGLDTDESNPASKLLLHVLAAVAQFERELIRERVSAGMRTAKVRGTRTGRDIGRPRRIFDRGRVRQLREAGDSWRQIASALGVGVGTVRRAAACVP